MVKFDVRNPSALAPDEREDDAVLDADVIRGAGVKRGAVNIDGYDSDSDNENFNARARERAKKKKAGPVNFLDQFDNYKPEGEGEGEGEGPDPGHERGPAKDEDDEDDMFADHREPGGGDEGGEGGEGGDDDDPTAFDVKKKRVKFLDEDDIVGQEHKSRDRAKIDNINTGAAGAGAGAGSGSSSGSDDEEDVELAIQEEAVDEEVGAGGLKRNAPKIEAFNMKQEHEDGRFDDAGNYVRKATDPDAVHDRWLEGVTKREMRKAAEAHEKREAEARLRRVDDDGIPTSDLLRALISRLELGETTLEALARLGKALPKPTKVPKWKLKKAAGGGGGGSSSKNAAADGAVETMDLDRPAKEDEDGSPEHRRAREDIDAITEAADRLLSRDHPDIYDQERELLLREYRRETGEDWVAATRPEKAEDGSDDDDDNQRDRGGGGDHAPPPPPSSNTMWEYRWTDGRDGGAKQGPFDGPTMKAWQDAGYFGEGVEFKPVGNEDRDEDEEKKKDGWTRVAAF